MTSIDKAFYVSPEENIRQAERPEPMLQWFVYAHLPHELQEVSKPFCELARWVVETLPSNPERTVALRDLLRAKDSVVRAKLYKNA